MPGELTRFLENSAVTKHTGEGTPQTERAASVPLQRLVAIRLDVVHASGGEKEGVKLVTKKRAVQSITTTQYQHITTI